MSEQSQGPGEKFSGNAVTFKKVRFWITAIVTGAVFVVSSVLTLGEAVKNTKVESIESIDMFAMPSEILDRYSACDYHFLFFCTLKSEEPVVVPPACASVTGAARVACEWSDTSDTEQHWWTGVLSLPYVKIPILAVVTLPHLPDAMHHVLKDRWERSRLDFTLGVFFLFGYVTLMIVALRKKGPGKLWYFAVMVVFGPYLMAILFWLLQHTVGGTAGRNSNRFGGDHGDSRNDGLRLCLDGGEGGVGPRHIGILPWREGSRRWTRARPYSEEVVLVLAENQAKLHP